MIKKQCVICGNPFEVFNYQRDRKFCSKQCYWSSMRGIDLNKISGTKLYHIYSGIKRRCTNKNDANYLRYGGRGIKNEWTKYVDFHKDMYDSFQKHIEKHGEKNTSIERVDNDGNYSKKNCAWSTVQEQAKNRSTRVEVTYNGVTKSVFEWADYLHIPRIALWLRLFRYNWDVEDAMTRPIRKSKKLS